MTIEKPFKTVDEQISLLKERRLNFINLPAARQLLKEYGYYEIVNGYKKPFLKNPNNNEDCFEELQIWLGLRIKSYLSNYPNDEKYIFDSTELTKETLDWDGLADFKPQ